MMTSEAPHALAVSRHTRPMGPGVGGGEGGGREGQREEEKEKQREEEGGKKDQVINIQVYLLHNLSLYSWFINLDKTNNLQ